MKALLFAMWFTAATLAQIPQPIQPIPTPGVSPAAGRGSITGIVRTSSGAPAIGALVVAHRRWTTDTNPGPTQQGAVVGAGGRYTISDLTPGSYLVCAQVTGVQDLDPCQWSVAPPAVNLIAGQAANVDVAMSAAGEIDIRVDDPDKAADAKIKAKKGPPFLLGVMTNNSGFQVASQLNADASGFDYRVLIPVDTDVTFIAHPGELSFENDNGKKLGQQDLVTVVNVKKADKVKKVKFVARGK